MNIDFFSRRSRIMAAGLCGAAVLAFAGLEAPVQAQEDPDRPDTEQAEKPNQKMKQASDQKMTSSLDLSEIKFEGEILRKLGDSAVIVKSDEQDLLLPLSAISRLDNNTQDADGEGGELEQTNSREDEMAISDEPATGEVRTAEVESETTVEPTRKEFKVGDKIQVQLSSTDAELVALENSVLTARDGEMVMQLPADEISDEIASQIRFNARTDGETRVMTLQEAINDKRELTMSRGWSSEMPRDTKTGVIVANKPGKLMLVTLSNNSMKLVQVPQTLHAGEAVSLSEDKSGDIQIEPMDNQVAYEKMEMKGKLISRSADFLVIESEGEQLLLPGDLDLASADDNEEPTTGSMVTVMLPAGKGEILAELDDRIVLQTEHGIAQLPNDALTNL